MPDVLTTLTALAVTVFRKRGSRAADDWLDAFLSVDPVLDEARAASLVLPDEELHAAEDVLFAEPDLQALAPRDGELDPMVLHAGGGHRLGKRFAAAGLLSSALQRMFFLREPFDEGTFVRAVLEGFDELRRAIRGERVRAYLVEGVTGVTLPEGSQVTTPWGVLRPAPPVDPSRVFRAGFSVNATCVLTDTRLISIVLDRAAEPTHEFERAEVSSDRARMLLPVACALASEGSPPAVPILTWSTLILPFLGSHGYSAPLLPLVHRPDVDMGAFLPSIEEWARRVEASHQSSIDVAARRLASSVGHRTDRGDALIDAVMVWENLVGSDSELTFRVTAALAKLLERDVTKRRALQRELAAAYGVRSRVVHGSAVDTKRADEAATRAVEIAVRALRACYERGEDWLKLSSTDRANALLLEEP